MMLISIFVTSVSSNLYAQKRWIVKSGYTGASTDTLASLRLAVAGAGAADTVIVLEGTYKEKFSFSRWSSPGNRKLVLASQFLLDGDTSHISKTIISGGGIAQNGQNDVLVAAYGDNSDSTWFKFLGFTVDSASKWGLDIEGGLVANCIFKNSGSNSSIPYFFRGTKVRNVKVYNNIGVSVFGFQLIGGANSPFEVSNSLFYNNSAIASNTLRDDRGGPWQQGIGAIIWAERINGKIVNNIFYNNSGDNVITSGGDQTSDTISFINNIFYKNNTKTAYFINWWGEFGSSMFTSNWYNNIIDNNYTKATWNTNSEFSWGDGGSNGKYQSYNFKNNLLAQEISTQRGTSSNFSTTFDFNYDTASHIIGTAKFKDTANLDFSLIPTSAGIGAGTSSLASLKDFYGNTRPNPTGSKLDMGAIESPLAMPTPSITSLQKAVTGSKKAIKINFSIFNNPKVDSVIIYRSTASKDTAVIVSSAGTYSATNHKDTIAFNSSVFTDTSAIANGTKYYYTIKAFINSGKIKSEASAVDSVTTSASSSTVSVPTNLTLSTSGRSNVAITWTSSNIYTGTYSSTRANFYIDIYRGTNSSNASLFATIKDTSSSYTDKTTYLGTKYYYYLVNRDANGVVSDSSLNKSLTLPAYVSAVRWYVDKANGNDANGGSSSDPFKTLTFAMTQAVKGDTVIALPGSYNEKIKINPGVTFGSKYLLDNTDTASIRSTILDATGLNGNMITYAAYETNGNPIWTKFIGLSMKNAAGKGKMIMNTQQQWQKYTLIDRCLFANNGYTDIQFVDGRDANQDFIYIQFQDSTLIQNSTFENNSGKIRMDGMGMVVKNNIFRNNNNNITKANNVWCGTGLIEGWFAGFTLSGNIFANNGIMQNNDYWQFFIVNIGGNSNDSTFITNNTFYKNNSTLFTFHNPTPITHITNNLFYKNTLDFYPNNSSSDFYVKNNASTSEIESSRLANLGSVSFSNNLLLNKNIFEDSLKLTIDPSSNLINSGINSFGTKGTKSVDSKDVYGNSRPGPAGTNSDIGAVESSFGIASPILTSADGADKQVSIKWRKPINGTIAGYEVFRSTTTIPSSASSPTFIINKADSLNVTDTALTNLTKYYYRVRAYAGTNTKTYSAFSNELSVKPNTPPTPVDTVKAYAGPRNVALSWTDTAGKRKYNIYRGITATNLEKIASAVDTNYYVDNSVNANVKYYFGISVVDSVGASSTVSKLAFATPNNIWNIDTAGKATNNASVAFPIKSIQYAIDNGDPGDTILINNGLYTESLQIFSKTYVIKAKNIGKVTITPLNPSSENTLKLNDGNDIWTGNNEYPKAKNKIIGLVFSGNTMTGGQNNTSPSAVIIYNGSNPIFESCTFSNNSSTSVFSIDQSAPLFINCLIVNNTGSNGIIEFWGGQNSDLPRKKVAKFVNSTIANNTYFARNGGAQGSGVFFNCIITANGYDANSFNESVYKVVGSIVDNSKLLAQSATNLNVEAQLNNDFTLSNYSPALGRAEASLVLTSSQLNDTLKTITYDYNYGTRPNPTGTKADLGAFESKYSVAAPQITRLQKSGTSVTLTWDKPDANTSYSAIKVYRDTSAKALDTVAALNITVDPAATTKTIADVLPSNKVYYYVLRGVVGTGANAVSTGASNVKSSLDTIFIPALVFGNDTASLKIRAASRQGNALVQSVNLVKLAADATTALPKLIMYSQEWRQVDSTKGGYPSDSLYTYDITKPSSGSNSIKLSLNSKSSIAKGKNDYFQFVAPLNINGDDEFDLVALYRKSTNLNQQSQIAYLNNKNLAFTLDTVNTPKNFFNPNVNSWNQSTNLAYKWDQKTFQLNDWSTNVGGNIETAAEFMDGNFDGKEELVASLSQVKWEPNASLNYGNNTSIQNTNSSVRLVKFVDINNDGIPDIFAMTNWAGAIGLSNVNGNPLVVFVSNKKDGKFYMYVTGLNVDWGSNIYFGDFQNNRKVQVLTRVNGGNYRVYDFDNTYSAVSANMQISDALTDGRIDVGDINNDAYPDVVTIDNTGNFIAYVNNHQSDFVKKKIGTAPFNTNYSWSIYNLKLIDLNRDGFKDFLWFEYAPQSDGNVNWQGNDFVMRSWIQTPGDQVRTAPAAITADDIKLSNDGYKVKVKWTPSKDAVDSYLFANLKVDTLSTFKAARINNAYNYRATNPTVPIVLDRVYSRNYPDSLEFNDINLTSKKLYYVGIQMVNKEGQASAFATSSFMPTDPLSSIDNAIPGLYNARFTWGDFNNDGLLDLAVIGQNDDFGNITKVYQNTGGAFIDLNLTNKAFRYGDIKWVDLNNDGWLDLAVIGQSGAGVSFQVLINNKGVFEVNTPTGVNGLKYSNMAFGDYDNNGTLDMFTSGQDLNGNARSYLYKNDGKGNFAIDQEFNQLGGMPNLSNADARFVDYDLDGDLDLIYSGTDGGGNPNGGVRVNTLLDPKVSTNNYTNGSYNNGYTYYLNYYSQECQCNLGLSMKDSRFDMGDIDGDGDIDIVEIGTARVTNNNVNTDYPQLLILRNQTVENKNAKYGNYFSYGSIYNITAAVLDSINNGDVKLVDFNNDGLLDITVTGTDQKANPVTKFYLNQGGFGNFTLSKNASIPQYANSAISWGDANGDGNMDLVISGNKTIGSSTSIYLNNQGTNTNKAPSAPANLRFIDQGQGRVLLQWDASTDDHTNPSNLYYNLKLGTKPGLSDLRVIQVNASTDQLQTPNTSLIGSNQYYIELPPGVYYWSVQAVDGNYTSSKFAANQRIVLQYPWQFVNQGGIVDTRIQPLEKPAFAWADVNNKGVFDFLYLGHVTSNNGQDYGNNNTPVGLYRNMGGKFAKLRNDSTQSTYAGTGTNFRDDLAGIVNAEIKWTDINNDGYVDLIVAGTDYNSGKGRLAIFRNKGNYKFDNITSSFNVGNLLANPKITFVDLDNNGLKDVVYTGIDDQASGQFKFIGVYKDTTNKVLGIKTAIINSNINTLLTNNGISNVNIAIGDLNKDLKADIAILYDDNNGRRLGEVYMNTTDTANSISFTKNNTLALPALRNATLDLIDYNGDGLLDMAVSGTSQSTGQVFRIYQNKWLDSAAKTIQFLQTNSPVKPFESGQTTWGDINSDGYPDVIFSGTRTGIGAFSSMALADPASGLVNGVIKYNELPTFPFGNYSVMRPSLGDFSGKKVLDLVLVGTEKVTNPTDNTTTTTSSFKILKNVRDIAAAVVVPTTPAGISTTVGGIQNMSTANSMTATADGIASFASIRGFADSTIAVVDSNYIETKYTINGVPTSPKIDTSKIISKVGEQFLVQLTWKPGSDDKTPTDGLSYAVSIGTASGKSDILDGNASLSTGTRKTPEIGNAGKNTSMTVLLSPGTYYWTAQSIDESNAGSTFSATKTIQVNANRSLVERSAPYDVLLNKVAETSLYLKQNDSTASYKLTAADNDTTAIIKYSIVNDATTTSDAIFKIDTINNKLILLSAPVNASYKVKIRATDNYGAFYEKVFTFSVIQAASKILVNDKDSSIIYFSKSTADSAKLVLSLKAFYNTTPTTTPVLNYQYVSGTGGDNNGLFDLVNTVLINKRKLDDADTIRLRVSAVDQYGLSVERIIKLVNLDCPKKPTLAVKASATACLPLVVNLTDTAVISGSAANLKFSYFANIDATIKVADPTKVNTTGTYYIKAVDTLGCSVAKSIAVSVAAQPAVPVISAASICQNSSTVALGYTAPSKVVKLVWYGTNATGGTASTATPTFNTSAAGTLSYYVGQADTVAGCYSDRVKLDITVKPLPTTPTISRDTAGYLVASASKAVVWYKDGVAVDSTNLKIKPGAAASYTIKTTENGCTSANSVAYYYLVTDIINLSATEYIKLAPNPFVNFINFDYVVQGYQKLNIDVYELSSGNRVATRQNVYAGSRLSFAELSSGVYIFKVSSADGKISYQFKMVKL